MTDHLLKTVARFDLAFERGEGAWLYSIDGGRYLDFGSGIAVNALGHDHPHLVSTLKKQASLVWHTSNYFRIPEGERLARRLAQETFADVAFFTNSGVEANEAAIKMARRYQFEKGKPGRYRVITFAGAFHGRTLAMISAGGHSSYLEGFGPRVDGFDQIELGDWAALDRTISDETAAILIEPIQGEGGVRVVDAEILRRLRSVCDERDLLLVLDEIQTGVGRTGKLFAHEWSGITPDIMTLAKGIGGGFPLGACIATAEAARGMTLGSHSTTFGGNPLAMAVGNAVLDVVLEPSFLRQVNNASNLLWDRLTDLHDRYPSVIRGVQGRGLLIGLRLNVETREFVTALLRHGLISVPARGNVVRLAPPLIIGAPEVEAAIERIDKVCRALSS